MPLSAARSTLAYLFSQLKDEEESESQESVIRKIGRDTFKRDAGTGHERVEKYMTNKCGCTFAKEDMLLEKLQFFRLNDTNQKSSLKNSATHALKQLEVDMSTKSKVSGRPNALSKYLDTRYDQPPPEDYEFRHCLKSILTFDPIEKAYAIDDVSSEHAEPALDTIFLSPPPTVMHSRPRRNAFGAIQLCPHLLNRFIGNEGSSQQKREECVIDFLTNVASLNQELVQPRAGARRAESLYIETMYNNILPSRNS